tara:strand:- start:701 stop:1291 length:591 start_codon:yes stop_codon:yes gene_type:complete
MKFKYYIFILILIPINVNGNENLAKSRLFIEALGQEVLTKIADKNITAKQREKNFRELYTRAFDNNYICQFVLGRHWKKINKKTQEDFVRSFNDYLIMIYAPKFKGWSGKFKTVNSQIENNMYVVAMQLVTDSNSPTTLNLDWRIILKNKKFKILDVNIDGVSMLVTQRAEFSSVIKNHPLGVKGLIKKMIDKVNS